MATARRRGGEGAALAAEGAEGPAPTREVKPHETRLWLAGALLFTLLFIGRTMAPALGPGETIQDDARQHVFWMLRFRDPELFRDDLIADYFQSVAPPGYTALYWALSLAIDPRLASKILPLVIGLVAAGFTFLLTRRLHPSPAAAFLATVLLSWYVWQYDDLASGSPRAFLLPTVAALCWALVAGRPTLAVVLTVLGALLYPTAGVLGVALLGVRAVASGEWRSTGVTRKRTSLPPLVTSATRDVRHSSLVPFLAAAALVGAVLVPELLPSPFGPTVSAERARQMAEFGPGGRTALFFPDPYRYWVQSYRTGLDLRVADSVFPRVPILFELATLSTLLPAAMILRRRLPTARRLSPKVQILPQLLAASFGLFFAAHVLLFGLYLPARFVQWTLPLVLSVAAGLGLGVLIEEIATRAPGSGPFTTKLAWSLTVGLALSLALYPAHYDGNWVRDRHPTITEYLSNQPKDVLVAGAPTEADSVPAFAERRVLVAREYALPYQMGYYGELQRRTRDLIEAYYAESPRRVAEIADHYGVDLFLVNRAAFDRGTFADAWAGEFEPFTSQIEGEIEGRPRRGGRFALLELARRCAVVDDGEVAVVPAMCLRS